MALRIVACSRLSLLNVAEHDRDEHHGTHTSHTDRDRSLRETAMLFARPLSLEVISHSRSANRFAMLRPNALGGSGKR